MCIWVLDIIFINFKTELTVPWGVYYVIMGMFWVCFYIFVRFFRDITGYKIIELQNSITYPILVIFILFVIIHFFILIKNGWFYYIKNINDKPKNVLFVFLSMKTSEFTNFIFWKPLNSLHNILSLSIPFSGNFVLFLESYFTDPWEREGPNETLYFTYLSIIIFDVLLKVVVSLIFFVEVILYAQVDYFLKFLPIVFIPILFKIFINMMKTMGDYNIRVRQKYFIRINDVYSKNQEVGWRKKKLFNGSFSICENYEAVLDPEWAKEGVNPKYEFIFILRFQNVLMQAYLLKTKIETFYPYVFTFTSSLYFIAGLVRLYIIFFLT